MSKPGGILAINLSPTTSGWAYGAADDPDRKLDTGTWRLPAQASDGEIAAGILDTVADNVKINQPKVIVLTAPFMDELDAVDSETKAKRMITTMKMVGAVETFGFRRSLRIVPQAESTVRKAMLGTVKAGQLDTAIQQYCRTSLIVRINSMTEAHAALLWAYAVKLAQPAR